MSLPASAQVVVIGAGFAGASTAYHLAAAGVSDVVVVEREATYGYHASGRNAALCRQLSHDDIVTDLSVRGASFLRHPPDGFAPVPLVKQTGSVLLCPDEPSIDAMVERAVRNRLPHERVTMEWMLRRESRLTGLPAAGGVYFPSDGVIDVHALLQGFIGGARARGVQIELNTEVLRFVRDKSGKSGNTGNTGNTVGVETSRGTIETRCAVNASGAWVGALGRKAGSEDVEFTPYLRHLHITERVPNLNTELPFVWYEAGGDEFYMRPEGAGYLLSGCDATESPPCDARTAPNARDALVEKMNRLTPWIADLALTRSWACLRTFTPDSRPVIGWDRAVPWLFWVAGLGGYGATASPSVGRVAAGEVLARLMAPPSTDSTDATG